MSSMDQSSEITKTIVETVAEYENALPENLSSVADKVDSETFHRQTATDCELTEPIEFTHLWYEITVQSDGEVAITP